MADENAYLVDERDILTDRRLGKSAVESGDVLIPVHLDTELHPDELVHWPGLAQEFCSWCRAARAIQELLPQLSEQRNGLINHFLSEYRDLLQAGDRGGRAAEEVNEWCGTGRQGGLHSRYDVHNDRLVIERGLHSVPDVLPEGSDLGRVAGHKALSEVRGQFPVEDFLQAGLEEVVHGSEVESLADDVKIGGDDLELGISSSFDAS